MRAGGEVDGEGRWACAGVGVDWSGGSEEETERGGRVSAKVVKGEAKREGA